MIETLNDKAREVELVASLGFAVPKTLAPVPPSAAEIEARLGLPVIVKPRSFEHLALSPPRTWSSDERRDPEAFCRDRGDLFGGLVVQEVIPGPDEAGWVVSCTFNRAHELLDCAIKRKLRMFPPHFGGSTFAVSASNPAIARPRRRLGKALGSRVTPAIEFRWDHRDRSYKYIELNPRIAPERRVRRFSGLPTAWNTYRASLDESIAYDPGTQRDGSCTSTSSTT